jgi:hypothetical protein
VHDDADDPFVEQQETEMDRQINFLSDDELNAVAGGIKNMDLPNVATILSVCYDNAGFLGRQMMDASFDKVRGHS